MKKKESFYKKVKSKKFIRNIILTLFGAFGVIAVWKGFWDLVDKIPVLNHPVVSIIFGFFLIIISGSFFKRL